MRRIIPLIVCVGLLLSFANPVNAFYTGMPASVVIGQRDFVSGSNNQGGTAGANTLRFPNGLAYEPSSGKLIVSDQSNNRVLIYNHIPTSNNTSADVVIGQPDMSSVSVNQGGTASANTLNAPAGVAVISGRLVVGDGQNNRILIWNTIPTSNNQPADLVLGQTNFTGSSINQGNGSTPSATTMRTPTDIAWDGTRLFISDQGNHRVLIFNSLPTSNDPAADIVIGQADFVHGSANQGGTPGPNTLQNPSGLVVVGGKLYIGDHVNHRVLIFYQIPTSNNTSADAVLGEINFTNVNSAGTAGQNNLRRPVGLATDGKRLFIACNFSSRVVIHNILPTLTAASHDIAIGQADLINNVSNLTQTGMQDPIGVLVAENKLLVAASSQNRVLIYENVTSTPAMNINSPAIQPENKIRIAGSVSLGERSRYTMQNIGASVNGEQESNATYLDGGRDNGVGQSLYEFYNDFLPTVNGGSANSYTVAFRAMSRNGDEDKIFYFTPFSLDKVTVENKPTISFTVNRTFRDQLKNNLLKYQVWYKKTTDKDFKLYIDNIPVSSENNGNITLKAITKLLKGKYQLQVRAINTMGREQVSNNLNINLKK